MDQLTGTSGQEIPKQHCLEVNPNPQQGNEQHTQAQRSGQDRIQNSLSVAITLGQGTGHPFSHQGKEHPADQSAEARLNAPKEGDG